MDVIPRKFDVELLDVFDVKLSNFILVTVMPETYANMNIHLVRERSLENDERDFHILIVPFREETPYTKSNATLAPRTVDNVHGGTREIKCVGSLDQSSVTDLDQGDEFKNIGDGLLELSPSKSVDTVIKAEKTDYIHNEPRDNDEDEDGLTAHGEETKEKLGLSKIETGPEEICT